MKKKIYVCPNCGRALNFSEDAKYTFYCGDCGDYFHDYEAETEEQARMEGVVDYTELVKASMKVKEITETAIEGNKKYIEVKSQDILHQIARYIYETIKPILETSIHEHYRFRDSAAIYSTGVQLKFSEYSAHGNKYFAYLKFNPRDRYEDEIKFIYFNADEYYIEDIKSEKFVLLIREWSKLKDSMSRMIPYALENYNKANEQSLNKQKEMSEIIDGFRL